MLSDSFKVNVPILFVALLAFQSPSLALADTLHFAETWSGDQLASDTDVLFPTRAPTTNGSSLEFAAGNENLEKLFVIPLVDAGTISANALVVMDVNVNLTRMQDDSDSELSIGDGNHIAGFFSGDNGNGLGQGVGHSDLGDTGFTEEFFQTFAGAGFPAIGQSYDVSATITITSGMVNIAGGFNSMTGSGGLANISLDTSEALNFIFLGNHPEEEYRINNLSVELRSQSIPEPSSTATILTSFVLIFLRRKTRVA